MAEVFRRAGADVQVSEVRQVENVGAYDSIVVIASLVEQWWAEEAAEFVRAHRVDMEFASVAYLVDVMGVESGEEERAMQRGLRWVLNYCNEIIPVSTEWARLDDTNASWDSVRAWAERLVPNFIGEDHQSPSGIREFLDPNNLSSGLREPSWPSAPDLPS
jgi:hypothetical protein